MSTSNIIFLRIAWMTDYRGRTRSDTPKGAGSFVDEYEDGGEVCNFYKIGTKYYGFARVQGNKNIRLQRLGADVNDEYLDDLTIIFFAKNPDTGGQYIVGWYKNARLYKAVQHLKRGLRKDHPEYKSVASSVHLVDESDRWFDIPQDGPGQSNVWYVTEYHDQSYLNSVLKYIQNPTPKQRRASMPKGKGTPWQKDLEIKKAVEISAMSITAQYYEARGFTVAYVHEENLGWDLEARKGRTTLLLEIKGLSGGFSTVELTPNEYSKARRKDFRLCVVSNALDKKQNTLSIFYYEAGKWRDKTGRILSVKEYVSARFKA